MGVMVPYLCVCRVCIMQNFWYFCFGWICLRGFDFDCMLVGRAVANYRLELCGNRLLAVLCDFWLPGTFSCAVYGS